jgi:hypothetical protein
MDVEFFLAGEGLGFTIYVLLQCLVAMAIRGRRRVLALLPSPFMLGVLLWTIFAYRSESNLWPIVMIFTSAAAIFAVVVLWVGLGIVQKREGAARVGSAGRNTP